MIVEDDRFSANVLRKNITDLGYEVVGMAQNGNEAIALYRDTSPMVVIMDFNIEGDMDGGDLATALRQVQKCSIVFITASEDDDSLNKIMDTKPDGYVQKPFDFRELRAVLELAFFKHRKEKELEELLVSLDNKVKERTAELNEAMQNLLEEVAEREKAQRQLEEALSTEKKFGKLKSSIISNLSHEFKTPLSTIRSSAQFLTKLIEKQKFDRLSTQHPERIAGAVDSLTDLLTRILMVENTSGDIYKVEKDWLDLNDLAEEVIEELSHAECQGTQVAYTYSCKEDQINSDYKLLKLILSNLLSNACKYSEMSNEISLDIEVQNGNLEIVVGDKGIGMSEEDKEQIFYRFFRGENVGSIEGTGIGMSIMKRCLDALEGTVEIESELGKGTTFSLSIPL